MQKLIGNKVVEAVLAAHIDTRSDDRKLILEVWARYGLVLDPQQQAAFFSKELPSSESIRRTRQKLQEQGLYQANAFVQAARKAKQEQVRGEVRAIPTLQNQISLDNLI